MYLVVLTGCASVSPVVQKPEHRASTSFDIGKEQSVSVGEAIVAEENLFFFNGLVAITDYNPPGQFGVTYPAIKEGAQFKLYGNLGNGDRVYEQLNGDKALDLYGRPVAWSYCLAVNSSGQPYGITPCTTDYVSKWAAPVDFLREAKLYQKGSFRMELLYNGKSRDMIKITYREFDDGMARPAFTQDLMYDLAESRTISFKKMSIDVIEATNSHIRFVVRSTMK